MVTMASRPCDTCNKECVGGIIYGNCQEFLAWRRELNHIDIRLEDFFNFYYSTVIFE
jgi:hypothetical protein